MPQPSTALARTEPDSLQLTRERYSYPICGARKKQTPGWCTQKAGWRTDHPGKGKCTLHGGSSPIKHGRYSTVSDVRLGDILEELRNDPNPLDVVPEVLVARGLVRRFLDDYTSLTNAVVAWNETRDPDSRPARIPDLEDAVPLLESISRMVYRIERAQSSKFIPRGQFYRVMMAMGMIVNARAPREVAEAIRADWLRIEIP